MANPRQEDRSPKSMEDAARRTTERAAEQTSRIGQAAADQTTRICRRKSGRAGALWESDYLKKIWRTRPGNCRPVRSEIKFCGGHDVWTSPIT